MLCPPMQEKVAVIRAGGPRAGKTTKIRQQLEEQKRLGLAYAYICPDDVCLKGTMPTYCLDTVVKKF